MADYRHERSGRHRLTLPKKALGDLGLATPTAPRSSRRSRERELQALLCDFRSGLLSLRGLISRTRSIDSNYVVKTQSTSVEHDHQSTKVIERERQIIERTIMSLPLKERELIMRTYNTHLNTAISQQTPQAYAAILRGAQMVQPATVLRPNQPYVKELMATARAIRSGRAAFLPGDVKAKARDLLTILFGHQQATTMLHGRDEITRKLISQYRLIPQAVQAAVSPTPARRATRVERELQAKLQQAMVHGVSPVHKSGTPITPLELAALAPVLPALHTGGVAAGGGSGEYRMQVGESVDVINRTDSIMTAPMDPPPAGVPQPKSQAPGRLADSKIPSNPEPLNRAPLQSAPDSLAPMPANSKQPSKSQSQGGRMAPIESVIRDTAQPMATASASGKSISANDVDGLSDWIADVERKLRNL